MTVTAIAFFFIHVVMPNGPFLGFNPIHLFVPLTLWGAVGAFLIASTLTLAPGRIMHALVFGH